MLSKIRLMGWNFVFSIPYEPLRSQLHCLMNTCEGKCNNNPSFWTSCRLSFSLSFTMILSAFSELNNLRAAYMQCFDIEFRIPDKRPLFNKTIPFIQFMVLCISMPSCLSVYLYVCLWVFVSKGETCKGYHFTHHYLTGLQFWYSEEETYFYKGNA